MKRALTAEIPLVGREVELDRIVAELDGPAPVAFVLAGAAGVGKTRLASEASRTAAGLGFTTAQAVASRAAASIPFGPFAPLLPVNDPVPGDRLGRSGPSAGPFGLLQCGGERPYAGFGA